MSNNIVLRKLFLRLIHHKSEPDNSGPSPVCPQVISRDQHNVSRQKIGDNALKVLYRLKNAGFEAYLVGGGVRDILLGLQPKDFDIATNAHPEEVAQLFRNSRLIGRRFRLVHVLYGREIIEVATFRAAPQTTEQNPHHRQSEAGQLLKDNIYGSVKEDAQRRDFTVNSLYYSIEDFAVRDFANGISDIHKRQIQLIGKPEERYREDPVRMLRALRFAAKLDFNIAPDTAQPIFRLGELLTNIPSARLFDEAQKIFTSGYALHCWQLLLEYQLAQHLFPACINDLNKNPTAAKLIDQALDNTDKRIQIGKFISPSFLYAVLLWHPMRKEMSRQQESGLPPLPALQQAANLVLGQQTKTIAIPRRFTIAVREMWELQLKLPNRHGSRAEKLLTHPRFRAAYDFLLLREESGEIKAGLGDWWTNFQEADSAQRQNMLSELNKTEPGSRKKRRKRAPRIKPPTSK